MWPLKCTMCTKYASSVACYVDHVQDESNTAFLLLFDYKPFPKCNDAFWSIWSCLSSLFGVDGVGQSIEPEINLKMDFLSIIWHARDFILIALKCFRLQINASPKHNHTEEIVVLFIYSKQFNHWNRWQCIYKMINQNTSF